ncbi:MAG: AAA family ATPase [Spirochaetales bacterium]|nr:AAA family ATPase [Spirochaetales bacterium]
MARVIRGKHEFLEYLVCSLLSGGHVLLEDLPGLGKTTVAKAMARLISGSDTSLKGKAAGFQRIQFTPDLLPYDITGVEIFNPETRKFKFNPGPVFSQILLADEINRAGPKVQSALLEVMAEHQVTVGNKTHKMDELFFVMATQNPLEIEGTYLLPAAQVDRFLMCLSLGYPDNQAEMEILLANPSETELPNLKPVSTRRDILVAREFTASVHCDEKLLSAVVFAADGSRNHKSVALGISPRGTLHLVRSARTLAVIRGRDYVIDQDLLDLAGPVWGHRLRLKENRRDGIKIPRQLLMDGLERAK